MARILLTMSRMIGWPGRQLPGAVRVCVSRVQHRGREGGCCPALILWGCQEQSIDIVENIGNARARIERLGIRAAAEACTMSPRKGISCVSTRLALRISLSKTKDAKHARRAQHCCYSLLAPMWSR